MRAPSVFQKMIEQGRFLARLVRQPKIVGAVAPSSEALARAMAAEIPQGEGPVLELGPGTGVVTRAILARGISPSRLTVLEYDSHFAALIKERFPGVTVIEADAFNMSRAFGNGEIFRAIVSSLPLLNFPPAMREGLITQIFARLAPDAPFIQFSYGTRPPVAPPTGATVRRAARILLNIPPARVWVYRKS